MKRAWILGIWVMLLACIGCTKNSTPRETAEYAVSCMQSDDLNGLLQIVGGDEDNREDALNAVRAYHNAFNAVLAANQGIDRYEMLWQHVDNAHRTAVVRMQLIYGNQKSSELNFCMNQGADGKWYLKEDELSMH